jgi:dCTP deaminase
MSIKSDRWIRRMALEHGMIEPFVDAQVRQLDGHGRKVISYGVSSYGYDMRVAPEFKIFTNALSAIVDPKEFDAKSFVEFEGDVCIVPPNSFALARSVEYFRIPGTRSPSALARAPTRAAGSSPTSRHSSRSGKAT